MTAEVLTTLTIQGDKLAYTGQIIAGQTKHPISGRVPWLPSLSGVKRAIIDDIKRQVKEYQASLAPKVTTVVLNEGGIFKDTLT